MAIRNLAIAVAFTSPDRPLLSVIPPLAAVALAALVVAATRSDWSREFDVELESPFSLRYALGFGALFLLVVVVGGLAEAEFGSTGFYVTVALSGLVSSAGATTSAVVLYRGDAISASGASMGILFATAASIAVKAGLTLLAQDRLFALRVVGWSAIISIIGLAVAVLLA